MLRKVSKLVVLLTAMALFAGIIAGCGQQAKQQGQETKGQVELGYVQWDSEIASTHVVKKVLEDEGYEVKITAVDASPMWLGVGEGNFDGNRCRLAARDPQGLLRAGQGQSGRPGPQFGRSQDRPGGPGIRDD
jgi:hypothetical protein